MVFGAKKKELACAEERREAAEWARNMTGNGIEDIKRQLQDDPAAARKAVVERKKIWEDALEDVPEPSAAQTVWGPCDGAVDPDRNLSLVIVEPREHPWMRAVLHNVARVYGGSGAQLYIFHGTQNKEFVDAIIGGWTGVQLRSVGKDNFSIFDYDDLLTSPSFYDSFPTSHCLVFQTDVLLRRRVPSKFFEFDYVGAPWPKPPPADIVDGRATYRHSGLKCVGNGGFSLRSVPAMRDLCANCSWKEMADKRFAEQPKDATGVPLNAKVKADSPNTYFVDEDCFITARTPLDRLPHNHEAQEFSVENLWHSNPCGLHKAWTSGMAGDKWFSSDELRWLLKAVAGVKSHPGDECVRPDPKPYEIKMVYPTSETRHGVWAMVPSSSS